MLYALIETKRGKQKVVARNTLPKITARKKTLMDSNRGQKVTYEVVPVEDNEKYQKKHKFRSH